MSKKGDNKDKPPLATSIDWALAVEDVIPLKGKQRAEVNANHVDAEVIETQRQQQTKTAALDFLAAGKQPFVAPSNSETHTPLTIASDSAERLAGYAAGVDDAVRKKLARGQVHATDSFDLHGFYEGDAWLALMGYLHEAASAEHRCVIIVHGKGRGHGAKGDMGIIKAQMAKWLAAHPKVLAFHTAQPRDGGAGAVYVYLKRRR